MKYKFNIFDGLFLLSVLQASTLESLVYVIIAVNLTIMIILAYVPNLDMTLVSKKVRGRNKFYDRFFNDFDNRTGIIILVNYLFFGYLITAVFLTAW